MTFSIGIIYQHLVVLSAPTLAVIVSHVLNGRKAKQHERRIIVLEEDRDDGKPEGCPPCQK